MGRFEVSLLAGMTVMYLVVIALTVDSRHRDKIEWCENYMKDHTDER